MTQFTDLLRVLTEHRARFILLGGVAAIAHGAARLTQDLDVVYDRSADNLELLVRCLAPFEPYPRGAPPGLPFRWDAKTLSRGLNFTLVTSLGALDLLGEVTGGGSYADLLPHSIEIRFGGQSCRCLSLSKLIAVKRAAGRPKDFEAIAELEAILEQSGDEDG